MGKVSIIATIKVKDGRGDDIIAAFAKGAELLHTEPGTEQYVLHRNQNDPNTFYVTELYTDQAALDAHMAVPPKVAQRAPRSRLPGRAPVSTPSRLITSPLTIVAV